MTRKKRKIITIITAIAFLAIVITSIIPFLAIILK